MKGPIFGAAVVAAAIAWPASAFALSDWPTLQRDPARTGADGAARLRAPLQDMWRVSVASEGWSFASAAVADETAYIGTLQGELIALDRRSGQARWRYASDGAIYLTPAVASGKLVFGSGDGNLVALDAADGRQLWSFKTGSDIHASPAIVGGKAFFASNDGHAYSADIETGALVWKTLLSGRILASPAVDGGRVYFATEQGRVAALDTQNGAVLWSVALSGQLRATPSISQDVLYIGDQNGTLRALAAVDGSLLWTFDAGAPILGGVAAASTTVYFASLDGKVRAIDRSGGLRWAFDAGTAIHAAPTVAGDVLVIGTEGGSLFLLGTSSGAAISEVPLPGRVASPAALVGGAIHVFTDDGSLTVLQSPNLAPTAPVDLALNGQAAPYLNASSFTFTWRFTDPDADDRQSAFSLDIASGFPDFTAPLLATGIHVSEVSAYELASPLEEGRYFWRVRNFDVFGASGPYANASFTVDRTAPVVTLGSPVGGERFIPSLGDISVDFSVLDALDPAPVVQAFLVQLEDRGRPRGSSPDRVAVSSGSVLNPLDLDDGLWRLEVSAADAAGNSTATVSGPFEILNDVRPPRTELAVGTPAADSGGLTTITRATLLNLSSVDDLASVGDRIGLGVAVQELSVDGVLRSTFTDTVPAAGQVFSSSFTLAADPDGIHLLSYHARDILGNVEPVHIATVAVDNTAPLTSLVRSGNGEFAAPDGRLYVSTDTRFALPAVDPVVAGAGAGVAATRLKDNDGGFSAVVGTFTLAEGAHELVFQSEDRVGNLETAKSTAVAVDGTAARTSLLLLGGRQFPGADAGSFYASSDTRLALVAEDPQVNGVASGLAFTEYQEAGGAFQTYASTLAFSEGVHALAYRSRDNVGNQEALRSTSVLVDQTPPVTASQVAGPSFDGGDGALYVSSWTTISFTASDPDLAASSAPGSGVARIEVAVDSAPFAPYAAALTFPPGRHELRFRSLDNVGNVESARSLDVRSDATAPLTALSVSTPSSGGYVSPLTAFALSAADPGAAGEASGVAATRYRLNDGAFVTYSAAFNLTGLEGSYTLDYQSEDRVGNLEILRSTSVLLDGTPPVSTVHVGSPVFTDADGALYLSPATLVEFSAEDPALAGTTTPGSGVNGIEVSVDGGAFSPSSAPLTFAQGRHVVLYRAVDKVGNVEAERELRLRSDATPPVTSFEPGVPLFSGSDGSLFAPAGVSYALPAVDPLADDVASGLALTRYALDAGDFQAYSSSFNLTEGIRRVDFQSQDRVGNLELLKGATVFVDATPPATLLLVSTPVFSGYVSAVTRFILTTEDPVTNGVASGVRSVQYRLNGGAFVTSPLDFALSGPDGAFTLEYQGQDNVGNLEVLRSTTVFLDQTPPVTTVQVGASSFTAADGTLYVDPATSVSLSAVDAGAGVERIETSVDGAPFTAYAAPLSFAEGRHTLQYRAVDRVGNVEAARSLSLRSDATAPRTVFLPSGTLFSGAGGELYAPVHFSYALPAEDPVVGDVASGLAFTRYALDGGPHQAYATTFLLSEGVRRVDFQSQDNLGHLELLKSATVFVDATAPQTTLGIGEPRFASGGTLYVSTATPFTLAPQDPAVNGVASGVSGASYRLDDGAFAPYASAFKLPVPDGARTVGWRAADNVGNVEVEKSTSVTLDATAPRSSLLLMGGRQVPGPGTASFYASSDTRVAFTAEDPVTGGAASGLARILWRDNGGAFSTFVLPLALSEGRHALDYQGEDNVANQEVGRSTTVLVDASAPVTAVSIGVPSFTGTGGELYVSPATLVSFTAADPALASGEAGSGVERVEAAVDAAAFAPLGGPLSFPEGLHAVRYRALDRVGNVEAERALAPRSDGTAPASVLVIGEPSLPLSDGTVLVSSLTALSITAEDPTVAGVASGVRETLFRVADGTAVFQAFTAPFVLAGGDGARTLEFYSRDQVLNAEPVRSRALLLDATVPDASISSPHGEGGICSVVRGLVPVRGTARDTHFSHFLLEAAPGRDAAAGFVQVSSGAAAVEDGLLGTWDSRALSGWQTLRLTVRDQVRNASVVTLSVFVGDPGRLLVLGDHEMFNMPQGVAAGAEGRIYVADTNDDRVQVFSSTGTLLASFGRGHGRHEDKTSELRLNKPKGVAVDAQGAIFVADTHGNRVLKLSATGQVLLELGRRKAEKKEEHREKGGKKDDDDGDDEDEDRERHEFLPGKGPGEFRHPSGVALDAAGNIYVADTDNNRVQKLAPDGTFVLAFELPPVPAEGEREDEDRDCEKPELGRPVGIAIDGAGRIYVADPSGARALKYDPAGELLKTIPVNSTRKGGGLRPGRPEGIAVSPDGRCVLVSDSRASRVLKFDGEGALTLAFGEPGKIRDGRPLPARLLLRKPAGLALDAEGRLYVADRNNDRIQVFGAPDGGPTLVVPPPSHKHDDEHVARDVVERDEGGEVERGDKAGVRIPPGALAQDLKITVSASGSDGESYRERDREDRNLKVVSAPVEFGPHGTSFEKPVTLVLPYTAELIAAQEVAESSLKVHYWNDKKAEWEALESEVDKESRTVKAKTPHFSLYQVLGSTGAGTAAITVAADASFGFKEQYAFPNPARGAGPVTFRVQPGVADSVTVRVYDVSGRKVHESSNFSDRGAFDDGNGKGAQFTYDHVWDVSGVGSGVYTYVVTARKGGERDIHKTGKIGLLK